MPSSNPRDDSRLTMVVPFFVFVGTAAADRIGERRGKNPIEGGSWLTRGVMRTDTFFQALCEPDAAGIPLLNKGSALSDIRTDPRHPVALLQNMRKPSPFVSWLSFFPIISLLAT